MGMTSRAVFCEPLPIASVEGGGKVYQLFTSLVPPKDYESGRYGAHTLGWADRFIDRLKVYEGPGFKVLPVAVAGNRASLREIELTDFVALVTIDYLVGVKEGSNTHVEEVFAKLQEGRLRGWGVILEKMDISMLKNIQTPTVAEHASVRPWGELEKWHILARSESGKKNCFLNIDYTADDHIEEYCVQPLVGLVLHGEKCGCASCKISSATSTNADSGKVSTLWKKMFGALAGKSR